MIELSLPDEVQSFNPNFNTRLGDAKIIHMAKPQIGAEEKQAVMEVLDSGIIAQGPRVKAFEEGFAEMCGTKFAVATSSGTTALHLALLAHGIGAGDEVITSAFTFIASANSILFTGARPVFVDIDPKTFNLNPDLIEAAITPKTKAIMPVRPTGWLAIWNRSFVSPRSIIWRSLKMRVRVMVLYIKTERLVRLELAPSRYIPTKNMTSGEGGMITTNNPVIDEKCRVLRQHGMRRRYYHDELGYNFRMTDIHAAIGLAQLKKLGGFNTQRQANAKMLSENFEGRCGAVYSRRVGACLSSVYNSDPNGKRDALRANLQEKGVSSEVYYPVPIHQQSFYVSELGYKDSLPETEQATLEVLSLPVHVGLPSDLSDRFRRKLIYRSH